MDNRFDPHKEIKDSEQRLRTILNHLLVGLVIISERGQIEALNPAAENLFGADVQGKHCQKLFYSESESLDPLYFLEQLYEKSLNEFTKAECINREGSRFSPLIALSELNTHEGNRYILQVVEI